MTTPHLNKDLLDLTFPYIGRADQVQGPGGNTSVKGELGEMIIKASGFRFEEITTEKGFSVVNYRNIKDYFYSVEIANKNNEEKLSVALISDNILRDQGGNLYPKPSMETGFHAVLDKYVLHTHSVWSNLINCSKDKEALLVQIRKQTRTSITLIPYISPGFGLSYIITRLIKDSIQRNEKPPRVFFLANHGIIAHGESILEVQRYLMDVDQVIKNLLSIGENYPSAELEEKEPQFYIPSHPFVNDRILHYKADGEFFNQVLFPDQTVFFKNNISFNQADSDKKIRINKEFNISYHTNLREAKSIHETMVAYLFIYDTILKSGQKIQFIPDVEIDYINNMDMEKYRKSLME